MSPKRVVLAIVLALGEVAGFGRGDVWFRLVLNDLWASFNARVVPE